VSLEKNLLKEWPEKGPSLVWDSSVVNPGKDDGLGISWSTVSIANGRLFTVGSKDGSCYVFCLDIKTGKLVWKERGAGFRSAGVVYADGDLYFRYEDNVLDLVEATPKGYHLRSKFQIGTGNPTYQERNSATGSVMFWPAAAMKSA
jgi:outer membrane protein assembly factor BamB